jgi:hypothetical protein
MEIEQQQQQQQQQQQKSTSKGQSPTHVVTSRNAGTALATGCARLPAGPPSLMSKPILKRCLGSPGDGSLNLFLPGTPCKARPC